MRMTYFFCRQSTPTDLFSRLGLAAFRCSELFRISHPHSPTGEGGEHRRGSPACPRCHSATNTEEMALAKAGSVAAATLSILVTQSSGFPEPNLCETRSWAELWLPLVLLGLALGPDPCLGVSSPAPTT